MRRREARSFFFIGAEVSSRVGGGVTSVRGCFSAAIRAKGSVPRITRLTTRARAATTQLYLRRSHKSAGSRNTVRLEERGADATGYRFASDAALACFITIGA